MERVVFFYDGFNMYHALNDIRFQKYKWLNLRELATRFVTKADKIQEVYYFSAFAHWDGGKVKRHQNYIKALKLNNVEIVLGEFKKKDRKCRAKCKQRYRTFEEKQTDVNMALYLFKLAFEDKYDRAVIVSADSDLIPAIKTVQETFPHKKIGVIIPIGHRCEELKNEADFYIKMKEKHLASALLPGRISLGGGQFLECPQEWQ